VLAVGEARDERRLRKRAASLPGDDTLKACGRWPVITCPANRGLLRNLLSRRVQLPEENLLHLLVSWDSILARARSLATQITCRAQRRVAPRLVCSAPWDPHVMLDGSVGCFHSSTPSIHHSRAERGSRGAQGALSPGTARKVGEGGRGGYLFSSVEHLRGAGSATWQRGGKERSKRVRTATATTDVSSLARDAAKKRCAFGEDVGLIRLR